MHQYIVIFEVFNSEEVYYCENLDRVKQLIEEMTITKEEKQKVRVFELKSEIELNTPY
jgi:hypothetical protein